LIRRKTCASRTCWKADW